MTDPHSPDPSRPARSSSLSLLRQDTRGLSTVEYLILLALIAVASLSLWQKIGGHVKKEASKAEKSLTNFGKVKD